MACRQVCKNDICKISSCLTTCCQVVCRAGCLPGPRHYTLHTNNRTHYPDCRHRNRINIYITSKPWMYKTLSILRTAWILQHQNENYANHVIVIIERNVGDRCYCSYPTCNSLSEIKV